MVNNAHKVPGIDEFRTILKKHSLKATPQRLAVHEAMLELGHASADMVTDAVKKAGKHKITVASVYNILSQLALLGVYQHRLSANNKMYFDVSSFNHIHLYDVENNTYKDIIDDELINTILSNINRRRFRGYKVDGIDVHILCHPTKSKSKSIS